MKREMLSIGHRVNAQEMQEILSVAKSLYPRRKSEVHQANPLCENEETKYSVNHNLTHTELEHLCDVYNLQFGIKFEVLNIDKYTMEQLIKVIDDALCHLYEFKIENAQILYRQLNR